MQLKKILEREAYVACCRTRSAFHLPMEDESVDGIVGAIKENETSRINGSIRFELRTM